jgi:adenylate cyclase
MDLPHTERRLAAIFAADVVGYSRLMSQREEATLAVLHDCLEIFHHCISEHHGRVFGAAGDSVIAEFPSAVEAVRAALEIQQSLLQRNEGVDGEDCMHFRIGLNIGDVIVEGNNLMGEGVNIASRLEGLAEPGGICISDNVFQQVHNKVPAEFQDLGTQILKNIPAPVQTYRVFTDGSRISIPEQTKRASPSKPKRFAYVLGAVITALAVGSGYLFKSPLEVFQTATANPSIAVLPFSNMSSDPGQEYFVDGMTEDLITDFSRLSNLTVIAWHTSSSYKGQKVKPQQVGKDLGVGYILDGSVRKSDNRLRITAQLVDTADGKQIWSQRYDRKLTQVFQVQDDVTKKIVAALAVKLTTAEKGQLGRTGTVNSAAYDAFLQGQRYYRQQDKESNQLAWESYQRAVDLDSTYARAYGGLAICLAQRFQRGWTDSPLETLDRALDLARQAVALGDYIPQTYWALGFVHMIRKEYAQAEKAVEKAINVAPNYADGYGLLALININLGKGERAVEQVTKGMRLNPYYTWEYLFVLGAGHYIVGHYNEAITELVEAQARNEFAVPIKLYLIASYVRSGRHDDAQWVAEQLQLLNPASTISHLEKSLPITDVTLKKGLLEDLRKAGLPE